METRNGSASTRRIRDVSALQRSPKKVFRLRGLSGLKQFRDGRAVDLASAQADWLGAVHREAQFLA